MKSENRLSEIQEWAHCCANSMITKCKFTGISWVVLCGLLLGFTNFTVAAQEMPTFHSSSSLVLMDVMAQDKKTGASFEQLKLDDFEVLDNGHPVKLSSVDQGDIQMRPLSLWFVTICPELGWIDQGSGFFKDKVPLLKPALAHLNPDDTMGVAHWCDNGNVALDLAPTKNREAPLLVLEQVLRMPAIEHPWPAPLGQVALESVMHLIGDNARRTIPQPLPAIVFIHGDQTDLPQVEARQMAERLLATSAIVCGFNNGAIDFGGSPIVPHELFNVIHFLAGETGGQVIAAKHESYADALARIVDELHHRYDLGFAPPAVDGKYHNLKVKLNEEARHKYSDLILRYRAGYVPALRTGRFPGFDEPLLTDADVGTALVHALKSPIPYADISFEVTAKTASAQATGATFMLSVDGAGLTWGDLPNGGRSEQVMIVAAPISATGEVIGTIVKKFEVREPPGTEPSSHKPVAISFTANVPKEASYFRFVIRDSQTGRIGIKDSTREQLFSAVVVP